MKSKPCWQLALIALLFLCAPKLAFAGHLFTQANANTPTWIQQGSGIQIDQERMEGASASGNISIDFAANATTPADANTSTQDWWQWSTGDVLRFSVPTSGGGSFTTTIAYDNSGSCNYDACGVTGGASLNTVALSGVISSTNLELSTSTVSSSNPLVWTVEAVAGEFSLAGFRIYFANGTINGTGAGTLNQESVVDAEDLPTVAPTPPIDDDQPAYTIDDVNQGNVTPVFDGGTLQLSGSGDITADFVINNTDGTIDTGDHLAELSGTLSGDGTLIKSGDGTLILSGDSNSHNGGVEVIGGVLQIASDTNLGDSSGQITLDGGALETTSDMTSQRQVVLNANGGEISVNDGTQTTLDGTITGAGALIKSGDGTLTLSGNSNAYSGGVEVTGGVLQVASDTNLGDSSGQITLDGGALATTSDMTSQRQVVLNANGGEISVNDGTQTTLDGTITGAGALIKSGDGTLTLSGNSNAYSGGVEVTGGVLQIASDANLGDSSGQITLDGGALATSSDLTSQRQVVLNASGGEINVNDDTQTTLDGTITGAGALIKSGDGTLTLSGNSNAYSGGVEVTGGVLQIASDANLGDSSGQITLDGGALATSSDLTSQRQVVLNASGGEISVNDDTQTTLDGTITGTGVLIKSGDGTLTLSGNSNAYSGGVEVIGGVLQIASDTNLGDSSGQITLDGGALATTSDLTSQRQVVLNASGGEINVSDDTQTTLDGTITGTGALIKSGNGSLILGGDSMFTASTELNEGILFVDGTLSSTTTTVASSARLAGSGSIDGDVSVSGILAPGDSPGTMTVAGDVTQGSGAIFEVDIDGREYNAAGGAGTYDRLVITGATSVFTAGGTITPKLRGITGSANNNFTPQFGDSFLIVTTANPNGITGTFSTVSSPVSGLDENFRFDVIYGANTINLFVTPASYATLAAASGTGNGVRFASVLDQLRTSTANMELFNSLYALPEQELYRALRHGSGELHAIAQDATRSGLKELSGALSNTLQGEQQHATGQNLWVDVGTGRRIIGNDGQASGYSNSSNYLWVGYHLINSQQQSAGIALGHGTSEKIDSVSGNASYDTSTLAGYYLRAWNNVDMDLAAGIAHSSLDVTRITPFGTDNAENFSNATSQAAFINLGLSYSMSLTKDVTGRLWTRLNADVIRAKGYKERGDTRTALNVKRQIDKSSSISVGYQLNGNVGATHWDIGLGVTRKGYDAIDRDVALQDTYWNTSAPQGERTTPFIYGGVSYNISGSARVTLEAKATETSGQPDRNVNLTFSTRW